MPACNAPRDEDTTPGDTHTHMPSIKVQSHHLKDDGTPKQKGAVHPCFSIAHANYWPDRICTRFTEQHTTYTQPIHHHCPQIPNPSLRYTLTIGPNAIDAATPKTIQQHYQNHIKTALGRRPVTGWQIRYIHKIYKHTTQ